MRLSDSKLARLMLFSMALLLMTFANGAFALTIKLGTVAPEGSQWHRALMEMAQEWRDISNGKINVQIYPGGVAGDDPDLIRKMRIGQIQSAALATSGIAYIYPDITALTFPNNIQTDGELKYVIEKVRPFYEQEIYKKGFKVICWSNAGWVHFFSKDPIATPDDMKKQKLFFWGSEPIYFDLLKKSGFDPIPLSLTDLLPGLQTGLVTAFASPPQVALAFQWYPLALNMCALRWQPLPGVVVVSVRAWEQIPENMRPQLEKSASKLGARLWKESIKIDDESISVMVEHGLKINPVSSEALSQWEKLINNVGLPIFLGRRFSKESYDNVQSALKEYRDQKKDTK